MNCDCAAALGSSISFSTFIACVTWYLVARMRR
jgi:hypothetical protein